MIPWKTIDRAQMPDNAGEISLHRRGDAYSIRVDGLELMNSSSHESEDALGRLACKRVAGRPEPCVLIGGLGLGFTLAAALCELPCPAQVLVAELVPAVVAWNREHLGHLAGHPIRDERVSIREADVAEIIRNERAAFDAILLDVDNGPDGLTHRGNDWLYSDDGLRASHAALQETGVLAVWSATPDATFTKALRQSGFEVEEVRVRSQGRQSAARHTIWIAEKG